MAVRPIALVGGTIALVGIVVGLYFQVLPENILVIRFGEMAFFSLCIPFLLRDAWVSLNDAGYTMKQLLTILATASCLLTLALVTVYSGGIILSGQFLIVTSLTVGAVLMTTLGWKSLIRAASRIKASASRMTWILFLTAAPASA